MRKKSGFLKKLGAFLLGSCLALSPLSGCESKPDKPTEPTGTEVRRGLNEYDFTKASYATVDRAGRAVTPMHRKKTDHDRYVGVFYFMWMGTHLSSAGVYDVTKLQTTPQGAQAVLDYKYSMGQIVPGSQNAELGYPNGMESPTNYVHWTNEPLFGYYNSADEWVITRHMEMLAMADVDFIFLDTTNDFDYSENVHMSYIKDESNPKNVQLGRPTYVLLDTILKLSEQGWDVPKVAFYTNTESGKLVDKIYNNFYASGKYDSIWFTPFDKPLIIGTTASNKSSNMVGGAQFVPVSSEMEEYFDVRESQWPNKAPTEDGFPWMDWSKGYNQYYSVNKAVNVNVAQHGDSLTAYSAYAQWGRDGDMRSSRGYIESEKRMAENWEEGQNIEDQWQSVWHYEEQGKDVEMVTVTGWNEWLAWKMWDGNHDFVQFVDNFSAEFSRDMEPDKDHYQDNFYLQLVRNVRKYKYGEVKSDYKWDKKTVNSVADFASVKTVYKDFTGDAIERDFYGFDIRPSSKSQNLLGAWYTDNSNRNDIAETRIAHDDDNLYILVKTVDDITEYESGENWMNVLIKTQNSTAASSWESFDYIINRAPSGNKTSVEKSTGGWNWQKSGEADIAVEGNQMFITVPLSALGLSANSVKFEFKVADNVTDYSDIMDYYVSGDSAPIGRLRYSYGY